MKKSTVLKRYGSAYRLAKVLGINESAVSRWGPVIPELRARQLAELDGELKFEGRFYRSLPAPRAN